MVLDKKTFTGTHSMETFGTLILIRIARKGN